ncbi:CoB--CoM heterodisulfide reductase iron-sulfur subunit B family protein [Oceanidesulfovibrio indonesiensis]|nr:CoB--CoM heterodisulfide reductase iron-sulfur subunit B family protein [Oceanidesulfovibrio indonesiensis]
MQTPAYAYYPGCSQTGTAREYDLSVRSVFKALGMELAEVDDWSCCGSTPAHSLDTGLMAALAARNLKQVQKMGLEQALTPCPSCLGALRTASRHLVHPEKRAAMNELLDESLEEDVPSRSILQALLEDYGLDKLREQVVVPLKGLKAVPYYGCLMTRPADLMRFDNPENPTSMDETLKILGATVPEFPFKVECCGASLGVPRQEMVLRLSHNILSMAAQVGGNAVVVACPLCHQNLDLRQSQINRANKSNHNMPVLYITQAIGLALGLMPEELGLNKHAVSVRGLLDTISGDAAVEEKGAAS